MGVIDSAIGGFAFGENYRGRKKSFIAS